MKKLYIIITAAIFFSQNTKGQIIYTDINPDSVVHGRLPATLYDLDLNNDGVNDFEFTIQTATTGRCGAECGRRIDNHIIVFPASGSNNQIRSDHFPLALKENSIIDSTQTLWSGASPQILRIANGCESCGGFKISGQWDTTADRYLGLKLISHNQTYYGWIRLSVDVSLISATLTIKDYAYNSIPNQPVRAGEKNCFVPKVHLKADGPLSFCKGDSVKLTANGTGYLYQWKKNGKNISGATSKTYTAKTAGIYKCKVINSCGSKTSKDDTVIMSCMHLNTNNVTSNEKINSGIIQLYVSPNPFLSSTTLSFTLPQLQKIFLSIYDMNGRLIKTLADAQIQQGTHQLIWNARDEKENIVPSGIYFLKIQARNYTETKKLVIIK